MSVQRRAADCTSTIAASPAFVARSLVKEEPGTSSKSTAKRDGEIAVRIALVSEHASPLAAIGGVDAGGQNVHVA